MVSESWSGGAFNKTHHTVGVWVCMHGVRQMQVQLDDLAHVLLLVDGAAVRAGLACMR
jgi:hypothetical protein